MNKRIQELSEQAHHITADELAHLQRVHNRTYDLNESAAIYNEKFAELIVGECIAICQDIDGEDNIDAKSGRQDCAVEIQEHFGVEE